MLSSAHVVSGILCMSVAGLAVATLSTMVVVAGKAVLLGIFEHSGVVVVSVISLGSTSVVTGVSCSGPSVLPSLYLATGGPTIVLGTSTVVL